MKLNLAATVLAASLLAGAPTARAQDAEQVGLAREMLVAMHAADNFDAVLPTVMNALKPALTAGNPKAAKDWDEIMPTLMGEFSSAKQSFLDEVAGVYAKNFSKDELKQYVAFYKTPAGTKLATATPALTQQTMAAGQRFGQQIAAQVATRMREELRKRGNNI